MEFSIKKLAPETAKAGCVVVGVHQAGELTQAARAVDQASKGAVRAALRDLSGKTGSTLLLRGLPGIAAERVLLVGLGEHEEFAEAAFRDAVRAAAAALKELGAKDAALFLADLKVGSRPSAWNVRQAVLATREAFYRFDELKTQKKPPDPALGSVILPFSPDSELEQALTEAAATADGAALARKLGNLPANLCTPTYLAEEAKRIARQFKLGIDVLERRDMEKLGMGAMLSVTRASHQPPKFIVLRYSGAGKSRRPEVVVGIATLAGACVVALGHVASGLFSNDQKLADEIREAADDAWDRVWQMPLWEDYQEQLRSNFADMANIGGRPAGSVTAACFLARFTRKQRWAHIDIAGTAWKSGREKGSTGRPVPLLVRFLLRHAGRK